MRRGIRVVMIAGILGWCLAPFFWQILTSLKPDAYLMRLPPLVSPHVTGSHYHAVFTSHPFDRMILNSLVVSLMTTGCALALASLAAFALAKLPVPWSGAFLGGVLATSMFPPIATVSPLFLIIRWAGLWDTWWALVLTYTTFTLPLAIWVLTAFFRDIPDELYRAARVDGCTPWQAFWRVIWPLSAPGFVTAGLLVFIAAWGEFMYALTFTTSEASRTIPVGIVLFPGLHEVPFGEMAAAAVIVTIPMILLAALFQRRIVSGLTAGAVKG